MFIIIFGLYQSCRRHLLFEYMLSLHCHVMLEHLTYPLHVSSSPLMRYGPLPTTAANLVSRNIVITCFSSDFFDIAKRPLQVRVTEFCCELSKWAPQWTIPFREKIVSCHPLRIHQINIPWSRKCRVYLLQTASSSISQGLRTTEYRVRGMFKLHRHHSGDEIPFSVWCVCASTKPCIFFTWVTRAPSTLFELFDVINEFLRVWNSSLCMFTNMIRPWIGLRDISRMKALIFTVIPRKTYQRKRTFLEFPSYKKMHPKTGCSDGRACTACAIEFDWPDDWQELFCVLCPVYWGKLTAHSQSFIDILQIPSLTGEEFNRSSESAECHISNMHQMNWKAENSAMNRSKVVMGHCLSHRVVPISRKHFWGRRGDQV